MCRLSRNSGSLSLQEPKGPVQACSVITFDVTNTQNKCCAVTCHFYSGCAVVLLVLNMHFATEEAKKKDIT